MKDYYLAHKSAFIEKATQWVSNNIERHRKNQRDAAKRRWAKMSPEEKKEFSRQQEKRRSPQQIEKRHQYFKNYYQKNKNNDHSREVYRSAKEARRARENNVPNLLTRKEWRKIKEAYDYCCAYCGEKPKILTQDHVVPISKGGWHVAGNIVPACQKCNRKKGINPPPLGFIRKKIIFD